MSAATGDKVEAARAAGDEARLCIALVARAADRVAAGHPDGAMDDLAEAAAIHESGGRPLDASHCRVQLAAIGRLSGNLMRARAEAKKAAALAENDLHFRGAALVEGAEIEMLAGQYPRAASLLGEARRVGDLGSVELSMAIAMKHAEALLRCDQLDQAEVAWADAIGMASDPQTQVGLIVRRAGLLCEIGSDQASGAVLRARLVAEHSRDAKARADVAFLECSLAIADGDAAGARELARSAREHALAADDGLLYTQAAILITKLSEELGDRRTAYRSLAVGKTTFARRFGEAAADATYEGLLAELRRAWGDEAYEAVQAAVLAEAKSS